MLVGVGTDMIRTMALGLMEQEYVFSKMYISGNHEVAEEMLYQFKNVFNGLKWTSLQREEEMSKKAIEERFLLFELVVAILIIIAGIGWFNGMRHSMISRYEEYMIMRIHGMSVFRLGKMLLLQNLLYVFAGIFVGGILGTFTMTMIVYIESAAFAVVVSYHTLTLIASFLLFLVILLIPDICKISKGRLVGI